MHTKKLVLILSKFHTSYILNISIILIISLLILVVLILNDSLEYKSTSIVTLIQRAHYHGHKS
jgi:hypothetical protein